MKKSLALVARKKKVAAKKQSSYSKMAKSMQEREVMMMREQAKLKPKPKAKQAALSRVTFKHPGHGSQKVHDPKTGGGGSRISAARAALTARAKRAAPYARAALAGAGEAIGGISAGQGQSQLFGSLLGKKMSRGDLVTAGAKVALGRTVQAASRAYGLRNVAKVRGSNRAARVEGFGNLVRSGIRVGYASASAARSAYSFYQRNRSTIDPAVRAFLGKELGAFVASEKAKRQASYDSLRDMAVSAFRAAYPYSEAGPYRYVHEVWPSYMVVDEGGKFFKVPYDDEGISSRTDWSEVERQVSWETKEMRAQAFVFKEGDDYRWVLLSSNGFRDQDGEIVSTKALTQDVALWDLQDQPPSPLRWWHVSLDDEHKLGLELGTTDFRMVQDHTLIESGVFVDKEVGEAVFQAQDKLAGSIGFRHSPKEPDSDKIFHTVRIFERSLLPKESASNLLTHLVVSN